ncbi:MAG TPA: 50S ribosomal protein L11 methyltransferase, partial [Anaerolineales bacterium]|nr:50S ribosomal protein L11 methyltransferase [Anaerolineales bacterium]
MAQSLIRKIFIGTKKFLKSNRRLQSLFYDFKNEGEFSDLYEHEKMLADRVRVDSYEKAIHRNIKAGQTVIDLGTGTGILSIFAARQGAEVYAIDHSEFIETAKKIAAHNKMDNIHFVYANSRNFTPPEKVDVILHEQIGDDLFEENMVENLLDLKARTLKEDGIILPARFALYLEPVTLTAPHRVPFIWEEPIHGIDFSFMRTMEGVEKYTAPDYRHRPIPPNSVERFLCAPQPILEFDLNRMKSADELPKHLETKKQVITAGPLDGLALYFKVTLDEET